MLEKSDLNMTLLSIHLLIHYKLIEMYTVSLGLCLCWRQHVCFLNYETASLIIWCCVHKCPVWIIRFFFLKVFQPAIWLEKREDDWLLYLTQCRQKLCRVLSETGEKGWVRRQSRFSKNENIKKWGRKYEKGFIIVAKSFKRATKFRQSDFHQGITTKAT